MRFVLALLAVILWFGCATGALRSHSKYDTQTVFSVQGLTCQGCGSKIVEAVKRLPGVATASFDKKAITVTVAYRKAETSPNRVMAAIRTGGFGASIGHGTGSYKPTKSFPKQMDIKLMSAPGKRVDIRAGLVAGKVTVVDFGAAWCGPCRFVDEELHKILKKHPDVAVRKIDVVSWSSPVAKQHLRGVPQLPYVIIYDKQGKEVDRFSGLDLDRLWRSICGAKGVKWPR